MNLIKHQSIQFIIMIIVGILFNPMNVLAYRFNDLYLSLTLFYGGVLMASNMVWAHEIVHLLAHGKCNWIVFSIGVLMSIGVTIFLLRKQFMVNDREWLKRMISHHSTALTTSHKIVKRTENEKVRRLAEDIIDTQEREIKLMKSLL